MDANSLLKKYCLDETHMPNPQGMNVVQISRIDSEEYTKKEGRQQIREVRHLLYLQGFDLPLRLYNMRLKILIALLGPETDLWIGKKIGLFVSAQMNYGEVETTLMIHVQPIDQSIPAVSQRRFSQLPAGASNWPPNQAPLAAAHASAQQASTSPARDVAAIGIEAAAEVCCQLAERGKTWDDLRIYLNANGLGELIAGKLPPDCPKAIRNGVETYLRSMPKCAAKPPRDKFIANWKPPATEVIDRSTGEVINPAAGLPGQPPPHPSADDIPF